MLKIGNHKTHKSKFQSLLVLPFLQKDGLRQTRFWLFNDNMIFFPPKIKCNPTPLKILHYARGFVMFQVSLLERKYQSKLGHWGDHVRESSLRL